jgi:hypothetical protein
MRHAHHKGATLALGGEKNEHGRDLKSRFSAIPCVALKNHLTPRVMFSIHPKLGKMARTGNIQASLGAFKP